MLREWRLGIIRYDTRDGCPKRGEFLVSVGARGVGTVYRIQAVKPVVRRLNSPVSRYRLFVEVVSRGKDAREFILTRTNHRRIWLLHWDSRKKRKMTFEQYMRTGGIQ